MSTDQQCLFLSKHLCTWKKGYLKYYTNSKINNILNTYFIKQKCEIDRWRVHNHQF